MNITNIYNNGREVTLFLREPDGSLKTVKDNTFFPYYYEPHPEGNYVGFDGKRLKKFMVSHPSDIKKNCTAGAYEADVSFTKRYLIDKVDVITPTKLKWVMMDIEVQTKDLPNPRESQSAPYPVSCIVLYDNYRDSYIEFFRPKFKNEFDMLLAFCEELKFIAPDLWLAHNMKFFDYPYLYYRIPEFPKRISPIGQARYGDKELNYPAGMSVIDTLEWWQKFTLGKEESYAQDALMAKYLGYDKGKYKNIDFSIIDDNVLGRCRGDVEGMVALEKKKQMIPYFDLIRRIGIIEFEDLNWNSRIIDQALLKEAKNKKVVLPSKPKEVTEEEFDGAYREAKATGFFKNLSKCDLGSAYPKAIEDFCLDIANINDKEGLLINGTYFKQNPDALLPSIVKKFLTHKDTLKQEIEELVPGTPEHEEKSKTYAAIKTVVNSLYGVMGSQFFRLYSTKVAGATTFLVRDLLHYVENELEARNQEVIYLDTDSCFFKNSKLTDEEDLNAIIDQWAKKWNNPRVSVKFSKEGVFKKILILGKCRYKGLISKPRGDEWETKGIETKRKDSTKYMKKFQGELFDKIMNEEPKEAIMQWIAQCISEFKNEPLLNIAKPAKLSKKPEEYKTKTIAIRSIEETPGFNKKVGDNFYYIYVQPEFYEVKKTVTEYYREIAGKRANTVKKDKLKATEVKSLIASGELDNLVKWGIIKSEVVEKTITKARDVRAFDEDHPEVNTEIDYEKMIEINIKKKLVAPFKAMGWEDEAVRLFGMKPNLFIEDEEDDNE